MRTSQELLLGLNQMSMHDMIPLVERLGIDKIGQSRDDLQGLLWTCSRREGPRQAVEFELNRLAAAASQAAPQSAAPFQYQVPLDEVPPPWPAPSPDSELPSADRWPQLQALDVTPQTAGGPVDVTLCYPPSGGCYLV